MKPAIDVAVRVSPELSAAIEAIVNDPDRSVGDLMREPVVKLLQHENADVAASAFERYDLVSAPVVDTNDRLVGRVTVDEVLDFVRARSSGS